MRSRPGTTGSSLVAAEQFGHDVFVRPRAWASRGDPLVVCREGGLDLRLFQGFRRGVPFYRTEPPQLRERDNDGGLAAEVDHLVRFVPVRVVSCLCSYGQPYRTSIRRVRRRATAQKQAKEKASRGSFVAGGNGWHRWQPGYRIVAAAHGRSQCHQVRLNAYDALRKSAASLLEAQGLRATSRGGHLAVQEVVTAQFGATAGVFRSFGRIRRARNSFEYPEQQQPRPCRRRHRRCHFV